MAKVDSDRFIELIKLSRTVDDSALERALEATPAAIRASADTLADRLVDASILTRWQCDNLLTGKHKGFRLGNYRLKRKLGRGGMSTVYLAEHALMKREAAIKVLPRRRVEDSSYLARFHREAQAAAALDHSNIVRIYDVAADGNVHYIAMEFIDGQDLQTKVATEGRLDCDLAADYVAQSALGLQHAHDIGLIHRDIKPANLLANEKGVIKILDMGLAKFDEDEDSTSLTVDHNENVLGTVDYLSPEQAVDSHNVDHRADIYSLGCTFYFLLVGNAPFPEGSLAQRILKHQQAKPTPLMEKRDDLPPELAVICNRMMEKDAAKRPQTAAEVAELLSTYLASRGKSVTGSSDSGAGSSVGLAASVVRELTAATKTEDVNDVDTLIATATAEAQAKKDTKIARSREETKKPVPPLMPDELSLAPTPEKKQTVVKGKKPSTRDDEPEPEIDLEKLKKQLSPLNGYEEGIISKANVGTRLQPRETDEPGLPGWVWPVAGVVVVIVLSIVLLMVL